MRQKSTARFRVRIQNADFLFQHLPYDFYRFQEVGIVRNDDRNIKPAHVKVSLHFGHFLSHEVMMPLVVPAGQPQKYARVVKTEEKGSDVNLATHLLHDAQCPQIELLSHRLIRVSWTRGHEGGEVFDLNYRACRKQKLAKLLEIEPAMSSIAQSPIVEVEAVNIYICGQSALKRKCRSRPSRGGFAPGHRSDRGDIVFTLQVVDHSVNNYAGLAT
jgi:hypothetical protein